MAHREPEPAPGHPEIVRLVAPNPGPMTLAGTNTYVVGADPAWVIDPGPADDMHIAAVRAAAEERGGIAGVLLTHAHLDHSEAVDGLDAPLAWGTRGESDETADLAAAAASLEGEVSPAAGPKSVGDPIELGPFTVVPTPGHAADHVAFAHSGTCFCGDLILGEGSSIVPPAAGGGSLVDYMASLERLAELGPGLLCPGHGPWITEPAERIAAYAEHRRERERKLVAALEAGERSRERLLDSAWDDVPAQMRPAAALAMQAHLEKLAAEGRLPPGLGP